MTISARYANAAGTDVALEIDGAIYAVKPDDPRLDGVEIAPHQPPPPQPVTDVAFWQFMMAAGVLEIITMAEAEAAVGERVMPAVFAATLEQLPEQQRTMARIKFRGITRVLRSDDLFSLMVSTNATTDEQIDAVFEVAATIT